MPPAPRFLPVPVFPQRARGCSRLQGCVTGETGSHVTYRGGWNYRGGTCGRGKGIFLLRVGAGQCRTRKWGHGLAAVGVFL